MHLRAAPLKTLIAGANTRGSDDHSGDWWNTAESPGQWRTFPDTARLDAYETFRRFRRFSDNGSSEPESFRM